MIPTWWENPSVTSAACLGSIGRCCRALMLTLGLQVLGIVTWLALEALLNTWFQQVV